MPTAFTLHTYLDRLHGSKTRDGQLLVIDVCTVVEANFNTYIVQTVHVDFLEMIAPVRNSDGTYSPNIYDPQLYLVPLRHITDIRIR